MNSKERVIRAINRDHPDRTPMFVTLTPQVAESLSKHLGLPYEPPLDSLLSTRISHMKLLTAMGNDCVGIAACAPRNAPTMTRSDGVIVNDWGMRFKNTGTYNEFFEFPLAHAETIADIDQYAFPDPFAAGRYDAAIQAVAQYGKEYAIVADLETSIFETAWYLVGMEKFLMDLMMEPPYLESLLDRIMHINLEMGKALIKLGADIIWCGDDFGSQESLMMDMETWRRIFKPRIKYMFQEFRKINPDIKIAWHSCGAIVPLIPDFIEIGLDILNPIQPLASGMDPVFLKRNFGDQLSFFGGIDIQNLLPKASPEEIKKEVSRLLGILGKNGGYIAAPAHNIQPDTPVENILAMCEVIRKGVK